MDFQKVIYENFEKKKHSFHSKHIYIHWSQTFSYIPLYMHKILPTLGNEKEQ